MELPSLIFGVVGALTGSASLARLFYLDIRGKSARLAITTVRGPTAMLKVRMEYRPEFAHIGLSAKVQILGRSEATLLPGERSETHLALGVMNSQFERAIVTENVGSIPLAGNRCSVKVRLLHLSSEPTGIYGGLIWVQRDDDQPIALARLEIRIVSDDGKLLLKRKIAISATD